MSRFALYRKRKNMYGPHLEVFPGDVCFSLLPNDLLDHFKYIRDLKILLTINRFHMKGILIHLCQLVHHKQGLLKLTMTMKTEKWIENVMLNQHLKNMKIMKYQRLLLASR